MLGIIEVFGALGGSVTAAALLTEVVLARMERHDRAREVGRPPA
jgi:hypothetical protein